MTELYFYREQAIKLASAVLTSTVDPTLDSIMKARDIAYEIHLQHHKESKKSLESDSNRKPIYRQNGTRAPVEIFIDGSRFLFRNNTLNELRTAQPDNRTDFRTTISKREYDGACNAIRENFYKPFAASRLDITKSTVSRAKFQAVVRFLCENVLLIKTYGMKSYEVKNSDTFCQECDTLWQKNCDNIQKNKNNWQEYLLMRDLAQAKKEGRV
tara:strand:- start:380 stop:1018 length:639 start_codon:yes stop_codon:yes gene_type:complete